MEASPRSSSPATASTRGTWTLFGVLGEEDIEIPFDNLVFAIAEAGFAEEVIAAIEGREEERD